MLWAQKKSPEILEALLGLTVRFLVVDYAEAFWPLKEGMTSFANRVSCSLN